MSFQFILDSSTKSGADPANWTYTFRTGIDVSSPDNRSQSAYEIALAEAGIWYSWSNIAAKFNNQSFVYSPDAGSSWKTITIPEGNWGVEAINTYVQSQMKINGDYGVTGGNDEFYITIGADYSQIRATVTIANSYQLDFTVGKLNELLGFNSQVFDADGLYTATNRPNIENNVSNILIHCSIVGSSPFAGSYTNGSPSDVIYSFNPTGDPGSLMTIIPNPQVWLPVMYPCINSITMYLTDQNGNILDLRGENTTYRLILRRITR